MGIALSRATALFYAWEAGSAELLSAAINEFGKRGCRCVICALPPAIDRLRKRFPNLDMIATETIRTLTSPVADISIVGLGHPKHQEGISLWRSIRELAPSIVLLDHWKGLDRFLMPSGEPAFDILPTKIAVMDSVTQKKLFESGINKERIFVTGHLLLDSIRQRGDGITVEEKALARAYLGIPFNSSVILLASEKIHHHRFHDECSEECKSLFFIKNNKNLLWKIVFQDASHQDSPLFLMRPHPNENIPKSNQFLRVDWSDADDKTILAAADRVCGLSSMLFLQAVALGIPSINVQPFLSNWIPENSFLNPEIWEFMHLSGRLGLSAEPDAKSERTVNPTSTLIELVETLL